MFIINLNDVFADGFASKISLLYIDKA